MEIDHSYSKPKPRDSKYSSYLPFIIDRIPGPLDLSETENTEYEGYYNKTDDEQCIIAKNEEKNLEKMGVYFNLGTAFIFMIIFPLWSYIDSSESFFSISNYVMYGIGIIFLPLAYRRYKRYKKRPDYIYLIFDRMIETITLPTADGQDSFKIYFRDLKATIMNTGRIIYQAANKPKLLFFVDTKSKVYNRKYDTYIDMSFMFLTHDHSQEIWSMYVWYMDKNRPLPPGTAFDAFREKDFERRKAEGFPPPLYKSVVPTIEATPEQQQKRENYWKDEDYMVDLKEARFNLWDSLKVIKK